MRLPRHRLSLLERQRPVRRVRRFDDSLLPPEVLRERPRSLGAAVVVIGCVLGALAVSLASRCTP